MGYRVWDQSLGVVGFRGYSLGIMENQMERTGKTNLKLAL